MEEEKNTTEFWWGKPKERYHMQDAGVDGGTVKWISERWDGKGWAGLIWLRTETSCGIVLSVLFNDTVNR
jgi:hypothetical protein